jgi:adenine-specific DNA-methyltransferase
MSKYNELVKKLKEIFQIDKPELDFGVYRILNAKADEINDYLENTLKQKISEALAEAGNANKEELKNKLVAAIKAAEDAGFDPEDSPKVKDLRQQILMASQTTNEHENAVFTHMLKFFSRYYDSGDFVSKRRYKGNTYSVPYAGEEVILHWANKDQYYIKNGENFSNYSIELENGRKVSFKLLTADTAKDNRKDNDTDRRFVLIEEHTRLKFDNESNEYEEEYQPISVSNSGGVDELVIQFEYKTVKKGTKQKDLVKDAVKAILANDEVKSNWLDICSREPTDKDPNRTLLEKHLVVYTESNTSDYYIHKNLGRFLSNELDFYIKNEVMNLDNVQEAEVFSDIEKQLRMIQCLRSISSDVIKFLAQLENFQKKLWEKVKFAWGVNYYISLCKIDSEVLNSLKLSSKQVSEWKYLYGIEEAEGTNLQELQYRYPNAMLNTEFLRSFEKSMVLGCLDAIEDDLRGLVINADNFQGLNFLKAQYREGLDCIYIDPPYNATSSEILYKNNFKHSAWLSFIETRLLVAKELMKPNATIIIAIDENEQERLGILIEEIFPNYEKFCISIVHNPAGVQGINFSSSHEYAYFVFPKKGNYIGQTERDEPLISNFRDWGGTSARNLAKTCFYPIKVKDNEIIGFGDVCDESYHPGVSNIEEGDITLVYPIDSKGVERKWVFSKSTAERESQQLFVVEDKGEISIKRKKTTRSHLTVWNSKKYYANIYGSRVITSMFGEQPFSFPKSIHTVEDCLKALSQLKKEDGVIMDFFAGSGTTAHATINLNRADGGERKFILIEQGDYCKKVTTPRSLKALYSSKWKDGLPEQDDSIPGIVKVITLEGYEDTLNNLNLEISKGTKDWISSQEKTVKDDYLLTYMLESESKESLLNTDDFRKPFDYVMKMTMDSAGAYEERNIDLVETFNYLIGLYVKNIESNIERGYVRIEGVLPSGERALVLWRDCEKIQYDDFTKFASRFDLFSKEKTFDVIYVNGDHNLPAAFTNKEDEITRTLKLRQIEPEFLEQMFAPDELA